MRRMLVTAAMTTMLAAGGGGVAQAGGGGSVCSGFSAGSTLAMRDSCFEGVAHFVDAGTTLTVTNEGQAPHSFTAVDGAFDTGILDPGASATIDVGDAALLRVYCTLHGTTSGQGMAGVLAVGEPTPESAGAAGIERGVMAALDRQGGEIAGALSTQGDALSMLRAQLATVGRDVRETQALLDGEDAGIAPGWLVAGVAAGAVAGAGLGASAGRRRRGGRPQRGISIRQASATDPAIDG